MLLNVKQYYFTFSLKMSLIKGILSVFFFVILIPYSFSQMIANYDNLYRLDSMNNSTVNIKYTYGPTGNRLFKNVTYPGVVVYVKVNLQAVYDEANAAMQDELRNLGLLPTVEPYTALGYTHIGGGGEQLNSVVFLTRNKDAVVDWVVIELRDKNDYSTILASQSVLVQKDGDLVSANGISTVVFQGLLADDYYVAVRHRNHLGVMTANPVSLSGDKNTSFVDFTNPATATYGTDAQKNINGTMVMWGGNAKADDNYVRATPRILPPPPLASDITYILDVILGGDPNATYSGYSTADVNMDGKVRMTPLIFPPPGTPSDATFILDEVLNGDPNATSQEQFD